MTIKQPVFAFIAVLLLVAVAWFVVNRINFLRTAERTVGKVSSLSASNGTCGSRRTRHSCTRFKARVDFTTRKGASAALSISAGNKRGYDQPLSYASLHTGDRVPVVYNPLDPSGEAYEDSFFGVWGTPLMIAIAQIVTFFTSLTEPRRRDGFFSSNDRVY